MINVLFKYKNELFKAYDISQFRHTLMLSTGSSERGERCGFDTDNEEFYWKEVSVFDAEPIIYSECYVRKRRVDYTALYNGQFYRVEKINDRQSFLGLPLRKWVDNKKLLYCTQFPPGKYGYYDYYASFIVEILERKGDDCFVQADLSEDNPQMSFFHRDYLSSKAMLKNPGKNSPENIEHSKNRVMEYESWKPREKSFFFKPKIFQRWVKRDYLYIYGEEEMPCVL